MFTIWGISDLYVTLESFCRETLRHVKSNPDRFSYSLFTSQTVRVREFAVQRLQKKKMSIIIEATIIRKNQN